MTSVLRAIFSIRMLSVFFFGISSGLPLLLIGSTLKAWLKEDHIDLTVIGFFSLVGLPYTIKFLWAPLMDRYVPPFLGRRRGWILICQLGLALCFAGLAMVTPAASWNFAALCVVTAFLAASQDIAIDAYRREILTNDELGLGSSMAVNGYRVGMLIAGALALYLADHMPWERVYDTMAGVMLVGLVITIFAPDPLARASAPRTLVEAVVMPVREYLLRPHAFEILLFVLLFKIGDSMASDMFNPLYLDLHYTKTEIAEIAKVFGFWAVLGGGTLGGLIMVRIGIARALWVFGILQMVSTCGFSILAGLPHNLYALGAVIVLENVCTGMATTAYTAFMASLCDMRFTATQYALLSSLMGVPRVILGSSSGFLAKSFGWPMYFAFCTLLHIPGILMLFRQKKWQLAAPAQNLTS